MTLSFDTIASDKIAPIIIRTVIQALIAGKVEFAWKVLLLLKNEDHQTGDS
jgi:hypothetical protein